jgi:ParB family chromosome partitioning protein
MRLLKLPPEVQRLLLEGELDFSMARVLLTLADPAQIVKVAEKAVKQHLSVLQLEDLVFGLNAPPDGEQLKPLRPIDPNVRAAQEELERLLGVRVRIRDRKGKGKIVIEYASLDDFDRVLEMLKGKSEQ